MRTAHYLVDVSSEESLTAGFASFAKDFDNKLDICVPTAGINRNLDFLDTTFDEHYKLLAVNVVGVYHTAQLAAKQMIANGTTCGSIILVASIASYIAIRSMEATAYCGTKGAVRAMVPAIAAELVKYVCPSPPLPLSCLRTLNSTGYPLQFNLPRLCQDRDDGAVPASAGGLERRDYEWPGGGAGRHSRRLCVPG